MIQKIGSWIKEEEIPWLYLLVWYFAFFLLGPQNYKTISSASKQPYSLVKNTHYPPDTYQLVQDWDIVPLTSLIILHGEETCPPEHPEEVLLREFLGLEEVCECQNNEFFYAGSERFDECEQFADCELHPSVLPANQTKVLGSKICGKREGLSFRK